MRFDCWRAMLSISITLSSLKVLRRQMIERRPFGGTEGGGGGGLFANRPGE